MTIVNIHMREEDKKKLQEAVESSNGRSISEFMRKLVAEKVQIEECAKTPEDAQNIPIPDYIPKNKYIAFVNGAIVGIGDSVSEVSMEAVSKFPNLPLYIRFNGPKPKKQQYIYMTLAEPHCWKYAHFEDHAFPVVPVILQTVSGKKSFLASIDTAASVSIIQEGLISPSELKKIRTDQFETTTGLVEKHVYLGKISILETSFEIEFVFAPISKDLPFQCFIGRNLLDKFDAYFLGKKEIILIKQAED